ncbi:hypothetical protein QP420_04530 [Bifidobacterium sp. UMB1197]|nr:hypothetical protein [Bifidobacterium sp. UMB1197]
MMNKKAIAAFAAGATLLAGFAMATPAFAKDEAAKCTPAAAAEIANLKQAVTDAKRAVSKAERTVADEKDKYEEGTEAYNTAKGLVDTFKQAVKSYKEAKEAVDGAKADAKNKGALEDAAKGAADAVNDAAAAVKKVKKFENGAFTKLDYTTALPDAPKDDAFDATLKTLEVNKHDINEAKTALADAQGNLQDAQEKLAKAQCKDVPADPEHKDPTPTPAPAGSKAEHVAKLYGLKSVLDDAEGNMNGKLKTYHELFAKLSSVKAVMDAAKADSDAADQAVQDALAAGLNTSNPSAFKDLTERAARARAHYLGAQKDYNEVKAAFDKAYAEAVTASAAYNKALEAYKKAINAALADGVKLPGDLPVLTDPLAELNLPVPAGVPTPVVPGQPGQPGQPGKPGKPEVEKKKNDGKKLPGTGVGVTLTALAATMLAGMGAAVRKARH